MLTTTADPRTVTLESESLYTMALERINRNNYRQARDLLVRALQISPGHPPYLSHFGVCVAYVDRAYDRATTYCRQALKSVPTDPMLHVNLSRVYRMAGDNEAAYNILQRGWSLNHRDSAVAAELTRMGIRRPPFFTFLPRGHWCNRYFGMLRATLERRLVGRRQC